MTTATCDPFDPQLVAAVEKVFRGILRQDADRAVVVISSATPGSVPKRPKKDDRAGKIFRLARRDGTACAYCKEPLDLLQATLDHVLPRVLVRTNHDRNLVLACTRCNQIKGSVIPELLRPMAAALVYTLHTIYGQGAGQ